MNNESAETPVSSRRGSPTVNTDELHALTLQLMKAEVRLAKARATVATAEIDIKALNARLKAFNR